MRLILPAMLALLTLTGCTTSAASPDTAAPTTAAAPPSTSPSPAGPAKLGVPIVHPNGHADATVLTYRQPIEPGVDNFTPGMDWTAAEVRVCIRQAGAGPNTVSQAPWALIFKDGSVIQPSYATGSGFPHPEYPVGDDRIVPAGRCVKGWISFEVPKGQRPALVSYSVQGLTAPMEWTVPNA